MQTKKDFDYTYEQFKLVINQINFTDIKTLSKCLEINIKQCHRYIVRLRTEIANRNMDKSDNDDYEEIKHFKNGSCRSFNQSINRIVRFSVSETETLKNQLFNSEFVAQSTKMKLLTLITNNNYKSKIYKDNISVIEKCIKNKVPMSVVTAYTSKWHFKETTLYPVFVDLEKSILYALEDETDRIFRFNIYALSGCNVYENKKDGKKKMLRYGNSGFFETYLDAIDIFGYSKEDGNEIKVIINLNDYAKAVFLKESILFQKYIKGQTNERYPYKLKLVLFNIDPIAKIIIDYWNHIEIVGDNNFKKELKVFKVKMVTQLNNKIPD